MNKTLLIIFTFFVALTFSCKEKGYPKPENLISEKKMVDILYDIHLSEAMAEKFKYQRIDSLRFESSELYQSVLDKHQIQDSLLAQSIIFYSSRPKLYEKIYEKVIERLNMQQEEMKKHEDMKVLNQE